MNEQNLARYARQIIFPGLGEAGQRKLLAATVVVIGCGATGTVLANHLARSGVGHLRIVDRDFIELNNLQRQLLFDEQDIADRLPKAEAARRKLSRINSDIEVEGIVADVNPDNIVSLIRDADLVMDGADNFETRFLVNDACAKLGIPWIYSGVISSYGMTMTIRPGETACLRCLLGQMPAPGTTATCDTAGVLAPSVSVVASIAAGEAIKLLAGFGELNDGLINYDLLDNSLEQFEVMRR
ncbi:MAG: ThiF family adenylyltransferase, partial [Anaerolineae bacterium]|nr:ThiF family adenylyltransferase [Anaerolineae bacterium]